MLSIKNAPDGRLPSDMEMADQEERQAGRRLRAAFYAMIGDAPVLNPGDRAGAQVYLNKISHAIARAGWTVTENTRLIGLHKRWYRRAQGQDPYFETYGNRRQWQDRSRTYRVGWNKEMNESVQGIRTVIREHGIRQQVEGKRETPAERRARLDQIEAARGKVTESIWNQD